MKALFLIGRIVFGGFFVYNGINHLNLKQQKALSQYAGAKGVPAPESAVPLSGVMLILGGASLILGVKPKAGAASIIAFLVVASVLMHDFWNAPDEGARTNEMVHFSKNAALLGAALAFMGIEEPWAASLAK